MQKDIMGEEIIVGYRESVVVKEELTNWCCHACVIGDKEVFRYIEIICESGTSYFVYDNKEGYDFFEQDFMSKRFTAYHEFWTTKQMAVEERGTLQLKYFVRHSDDVYRFTPLERVRELLKDYPELEGHMTVLGQYDTCAKEEKGLQ